ncbi:MAG: hypothetical protein KIT54_05845 [Phycisphaeraceae bacterium]|nr:hypothetical protein [Phycisphaeraceae bacterium]
MAVQRDGDIDRRGWYAGLATPSEEIWSCALADKLPHRPVRSAGRPGAWRALLVIRRPLQRRYAMRAICVFCCAMVCFALTPVAFSQEFAGGWELRVKQHPSDADPHGILELWAWSDRTCDVGEMVIATGALGLDLSAPVVSEAYGAVWTRCKIFHFTQPYCQFGIAANPPMAYGTRVTDFNFMQTFGGDVREQTLYYDNPIYVMDIVMRFSDLTPQDVVITTRTYAMSTTCVHEGMAPFPILANPYVEHEVIVHVNGTPCRADIDGDGELTIFDFLAFQNLFAQGDPAADFDGDGELTIFDFLAFQNEFALGCD